MFNMLDKLIHLDMRGSQIASFLICPRNIMLPYISLDNDSYNYAGLSTTHPYNYTGAPMTNSYNYTAEIFLPFWSQARGLLNLGKYHLSHQFLGKLDSG